MSSPAATAVRGPQLSAAVRREEERLVREHLPLVGYLVNEAATRLPGHVHRDDLVSAGMAALALAARGFEPARGVPFGRFATLRIRGAILDELRSADWASRSVRAKARQREAAAEALTNTLGRRPTDTELAATMGLSVDALRAETDDVHRAVVLSLSGSAGTADGDDAAELLVPPDHATPEALLLEREQQAYLFDAIALLPDRVRAVIVGYYLQDRPMAELAVELEVTESRVSQLRAEGVTLLRSGLAPQLGTEVTGVPAPAGSPVVAKRREAYAAAVATHSDYRSRLSLSPAAPTDELTRRMSGLA